MGNPDEWLQTVRNGEYLAEQDIKQLCEMVSSLWPVNGSRRQFDSISDRGDITRKQVDKEQPSVIIQPVMSRTNGEAATTIFSPMFSSMDLLLNRHAAPALTLFSGHL
jgi:hypothetical protein